LSSPTKPPVSQASPHQAPLALLTEALARIRFGDLRLTVHDGRIVQIEVTEKTRFDQR
jgi:hypothetical protein